MRSSSFKQEHESERKAFAEALAILARRDHTEAELSRRLGQRHIAGDVAAAVIARLKGEGYLDDRRYAQRWAECAVAAGRGYGPRIFMDLYHRGVSRDIINDVLAELADQHDEREVLAAVMEKKFAGFNPAQASDREKKRIFDFLRRRGFSAGAIGRILHERKID